MKKYTPKPLKNIFLHKRFSIPLYLFLTKFDFMAVFNFDFSQNVVFFLYVIEN